jgi:hypothetical protein
MFEEADKPSSNIEKEKYKKAYKSFEKLKDKFHKTSLEARIQD